MHHEKEHRLSKLRKRVHPVSGHSFEDRIDSTSQNNGDFNSKSTLSSTRFTLFPESENHPSHVSVPIANPSKLPAKRKSTNVNATFSKEPEPWYNQPKLPPSSPKSHPKQKNYEDPLFKMRKSKTAEIDSTYTAPSSTSSTVFDLHKLREERFHREQEERSRLRNTSNSIIPKHLQYKEKVDPVLLDKHAYSDTFQSSMMLKEMRQKNPIDSQYRKRIKKN
ncbi:hypothetical protein HMI55_002001 [Coelomomyces lativittatus]|nr:hypothetical protein HMI55_002001 [Coelomomyces lativittatus]